MAYGTLKQDSVRTRQAFTLVELLVVMGIIAVLAGMLLSATSLARDSARTIFCANNLRQMGQAMVLYENAEDSLPLGELPVSLKPYDGNKFLYHCPLDPVVNNDSYSSFYVCRARQDTREYLAGCFRHRGGERGPILFGMGSVRICEIQPVYEKNGDPVAFGAELKNKEVDFTDGSSAKVTGSGSMVVLMSFREPGGEHSNLVKVKQDHHCQVVSSVTPGSSHEVVTPSSVASALGTKYTVTTNSTVKDFTTSLSVSEGTVRFRTRAPHASGRRVTAGGNANCKLKKEKCPKDH